MYQNDECSDKSTWGDGPWQSEPDRLEWEHAGLPCLAVRNLRFGFWCGYAAVPLGHPLHGKRYDDVDVDVHGGLTYANACEGHICHVPKPGQPDDVWWFGFDCGHFGDYAPGIAATLRQVDPDRRTYDHARAVASADAMPDNLRHIGVIEIFRTLDYVQAETNRLAEQLAEFRSVHGELER